MSVVMDRRHPSRLRWYRGCSAAAAAELALRDPGRPGCWVLHGGIELDAARMPRFCALLDRSVRSGARVVVLDLRDTEFLSLRVAALLGVAKADAWARGSISDCSPEAVRWSGHSAWSACARCFGTTCPSTRRRDRNPATEELFHPTDSWVCAP